MKLSNFQRQLPKNSLLVSAAILVAFSFLTTWFFQSKPSLEQQQRSLQRYIKKQQTDAATLLSDTVLLRKLVMHNETKAEFDLLQHKPYGFFLFAETLSDNQDLLFWNSQQILPPTADFAPPDSVYFLHLLNGYYVIQKKHVVLQGLSSNMMAYVLIPVLNKFYLEAENTQAQFAHDKDAINRISIAERTTDFPIQSLDGSTLFHVTGANMTGQSYADPVTFILRLLALALMLVFLHLVAETVKKNHGAIKAVSFLALALIVCRLALFLYPRLFPLRQFGLFDPKIFAADAFNRSLGDLLLTALFLCWLILFAWSSLGPMKRLPAILKGPGRIVAGLAAVFILIFTTFQLANMVNFLVTASKISFDVTSFFTLTVYSAFGFIVLALMALSYYYFSRLLFRFILLAFPNLWYLFGAIAFVGLTYLTLRSGNLIVLFQLPVLAWLLFYTWLLSQEQLIINRIRMTVAGILFWIFIFSVSLAFLIVQGNAENDWQERKEIANKYERLSDPTKERSIWVTLASMDSGFLRKNFYRFRTEPANQILRDSIINSNFLGFAGSYSTDFYVFDSTGLPINNSGGQSYEDLNNILESQSKSTGIADLYYYEPSFFQFTYITKRQVYDSAGRVGSIFLLATPRQFQNSNALYPNLFVRAGEKEQQNPSNYSYAIYKNKILVNHSGKSSFATVITQAQVPENEYTNIQNGAYDELWYKGSNQKIVIVAKKKETLLESITLFSYLFCAFLFMVGLFRVSSLLVRIAMEGKMIDVLARFNLRTQIHGTILFISVLSFSIIGVATISFFIERYNRNNRDRLGTVSDSAVKSLEKDIDDDSLLVNNALNFSDTLTQQTLRSRVREIADVHGVIVNLYDRSGTLQVTSDEIIYKRGVLSLKMHPNAYFELQNNKAVQWVQDEKVGQLNYLSIYTAIRNNTGATYAYLNVPSFNTQIELNQEISNFLVTIINLNAFIFLIAGVLALFITNRITNTFSVIGHKMRDITLGRTNEEIEWTKDDEIGELVKQYNKMVYKLEESARALAKSEREGAWREMARQVAHEIKNPLTPMKLSIQYLQRAIQTNQPNVQELTSNVAGTLIEQIDHLSKIAADFSQFANIGNKKVERMDLQAILQSLVDLYSANPRMDLEWKRLSQPLWIQADKTQMNRLFTNLLANAMEACSEKSNCEVVIEEKLDEGYVVVIVKDNGEGIPPAMQPKIFTPNFTTKTSGTGLGLAMCKSIAEQTGGSIWFETKEGEGTSFFVRLPMESTDQ